MIPGVSGNLLSGRFLDALVDDGTTPVDQSWARAYVRWWRACVQTLGPASAPRRVFDVAAHPLLRHLGFVVSQAAPATPGSAAPAIAAVLEHGRSPAATLLCTAWGTPAATVWRQAIGTSLAAGLPWAVFINGTILTIVDATRPWARCALTIDLDAAAHDRRTLAALWHTARAEALLSVSGADRSAELGMLRRHVNDSEAEGQAVCATLGTGVLDALSLLLQTFGAPLPRRRRAPRAVNDRHLLDQSLTIVYRLLFLFFAEARRLVPTWHEVYREAYGMDTLCRRVLADAAAPGTWATLQALSRLAHAGCDADDLQVTAFNGRLFAPARTPLGEHHLPDHVAASAVMALGTMCHRGGRERISFVDLGVEQLGAVYERVLDFEPVREGTRLVLRATSSERKTTGSFYTPRTVTDFLVRRTLAPLVDGLDASGILALRVLDPAMGSGAFLVAACRYLTDHAEQALVRDGTWAAGDVTDADRADLCRSVAERCLYGIDRNPRAVQLARLSLWLSTMAAGRPLTFLDHHLAAGNSLVGARLMDLCAPPAPRGRPRTSMPDQLALFDEAALERLARAVVPERLRLADIPSATPADVRDKERRLDHLTREPEGLSRWSRAADVWCGLALSGTRMTNGVYAEVQHLLAGRTTSVARDTLERLVSDATSEARVHGACHWELLFPEVFLDADGHRRLDAGFDAVLGNPPWEMIRADTGDTTTRDGHRRDGRTFMRFVRASGHYHNCGTGQINCYQLFVERALDAIRPGGRVGLILPGGIQLDSGSAHLRRRLFDSCAVDTWLAFDNRRAIFPIHRSTRFVLLSATQGGTTSTLPLRCGLTDASDLSKRPDDGRDEDANAVLRLPLTFLRQWDGGHLTVPAITTPLDLAVAHRALQHPVLADARGWNVRFGRELNATDDRACFAPWTAGTPVDTGDAAGDPWLPVVDGRHLRPFGVAIDEVKRAIRASSAHARLGGPARTAHARVCYRDVASATNRLTLLAAVLAPGVTATHTVFTSRRSFPAMDTWVLVALLNSLVANFLVRLQMTTHVTAALMARLPVPRPASSTDEARTLAALARRLSRVSSIDEAPGAYARLNVLAARAYGLGREEYAHVVRSFPLLGAALSAQCLAAWEE